VTKLVKTWVFVGPVMKTTDVATLEHVLAGTRTVVVSKKVLGVQVAA